MGKIRAKLFRLDESSRWADQGPGWVEASVQGCIIMLLDPIPGLKPVTSIVFRLLNNINDYHREGGFTVYFPYLFYFFHL